MKYKKGGSLPFGGSNWLIFNGFATKTSYQLAKGVNKYQHFSTIA
jgi:hypothetical protein